MNLATAVKLLFQPNIYGTVTKKFELNKTLERDLCWGICLTSNFILGRKIWEKEGLIPSRQSFSSVCQTSNKKIHFRN
jgi:hypothetical protein